MHAKLYRQRLNEDLYLFLTEPIVLQSLIALGALFHISAASFMNVCDCIFECPFITISGYLVIN